MKRIIITWIALYAMIGVMAQNPTHFYPEDKAEGINVDTHLVIQFDLDVKAGRKGKITVYDKTAKRVVDCIDMSIPAGPTEGQPKNPKATYTPVPYIYKVANINNRNTRPGTPSGAAKEDKSRYQKTIIGGFSDAFHFYPVICHGKKATIYLHNNMLDYGHEYEVRIGKDVIEGWNGTKAWSFRTKTDKPTADAKRIVVASDGSGDSFGISRNKIGDSSGGLCDIYRSHIGIGYVGHRPQGTCRFNQRSWYLDRRMDWLGSHLCRIPIFSW